MNAAAEPKCKKRWTLEHPELGTHPLPVAPYLSQKYFDGMREKVFKKVWLCTGKRVDDVPSPGDYFIFDLEIVGAQIIVVRGLDGKVRAHHNVCMHRGNKLTVHNRGTFRGKMVCSYHAWAWSLDGKLATVTEEEMFYNLNKKCLSLASVACDVWAGFVFINMDPQPKETLLEHLGPIVEQVAGYPFDELPVAWSYKAHIETAWQNARDSQLEGYHLKYLHKRTNPGVMSYAEDPNRHSLDYKLLGKHSIGSYFGVKTESSLPPVSRLATKYSQTLGSTASALSDMNTLPIGVNPVRSKDWFFDICYIFPNFHFIFLGKHAYIGHTFLPVKVNRTYWNARAYMPAPKTLVEQFARESVRTAVRDLWREDGSTLEGTQKVLESGVLTHLQLQDQEVQIRHETKVLDEMVGDWQ
jgi:phenylpropionate dioxygenase-like ring-hydroxylating dioxygenase large terminal subunit